MAEVVTCEHCGAAIVAGQGERGSGWVAPAAEDPARCVPEAAGHRPAEPAPMRIWAIYGDGEEVALEVVAGRSVAGQRRILADIGEGTVAFGEKRGQTIRYELRPLDGVSSGES